MSTDPVPSTPTRAPSPEPPYADQIADFIIDTVDSIRDRTVKPAETAARGVVYGLVIAILAVPVVVLLVMTASRLLEMIPGDVWIPYLVIGVILTLVGLMLWTKRVQAPAPTGKA